MKKQILLLAAVSVVAFLSAQKGPELIGSTFYGGVNSTGTIFQYTGGDTSINTVFSFPVNSNLAGPSNSTLIQSRDGRIYGLNTNDGSMGTLFEYNYIANTDSVMFRFKDSTGYNPNGALLLADNGTLYGFTETGGTNNGGTLFSYGPNSALLTKLVNLPAGANPSGSLIQAADGDLYGLTYQDGINQGGTIFKYNIDSNIYTMLFSLPSHAYPLGSLLEVGADTFYGLTNADGVNFSGTLFSYVVGAVADNVLYNFPDEAQPSGSLIRATDGKLYGTTFDDGANFAGTIFSYDIDSGSYADLHDFGSTQKDGYYAEGDLYQASNGILYGMAYNGGINNNGTIYQYNISTHTYSTDVYFTPATGATPIFGHLTEIAPPLILSQPIGQTVCAASNAIFAASVKGIFTGVQWQVSADGGNTYNNLPGDTGTTIGFTATIAQNGNLYRAVFTNIYPSDTTAAALLTVNPFQVISLSWDSLENEGIVHAGNVCANISPVVVLAGGNPAGGSYTGTGVSGDTLYSYLDIGLDTITYTVNKSGCVATASNTLDLTICSGINEVKLQDAISLYPNPVGNVLIVQSNLFTTNNVIPLLYDITGKLVTNAGYTRQGAQFTFNTSSLAAGVYFIQVKVASNEVDKRFVKVE